MHTQGPWIVAPSSNKTRPIGSDWRDIHSVGGEFSPSYVGEALEQDAQLIAAAPDLLEALQDCMRQCDMSLPGEPAFSSVGRPSKSMLQQMADAIAKATNANSRR